GGGGGGVGVSGGSSGRVCWRRALAASGPAAVGGLVGGPGPRRARTVRKAVGRMAALAMHAGGGTRRTRGDRGHGRARGPVDQRRAFRDEHRLRDPAPRPGDCASDGRPPSPLGGAHPRGVTGAARADRALHRGWVLEVRGASHRSFRVVAAGAGGAGGGGGGFAEREGGAEHDPRLPRPPPAPAGTATCRTHRRSPEASSARVVAAPLATHRGGTSSDTSCGGASCRASLSTARVSTAASASSQPGCRGTDRRLW